MKEHESIIKTLLFIPVPMFMACLCACALPNAPYWNDGAVVVPVFTFFALLFASLPVLLLWWARAALVCEPPPTRPDQKPFGEASPFSPPPAAGSDGMDYEMPV